MDSLQSLVAKQAKRTRWTQRALATAVTLDFCGVLSSIIQLWVLSQIRRQVPDMQAMAESNDLREAAIGVLQSLAFVVAAILFLVWLHGAYRVLVAAGRPSAQFTPGWAVGYWFIPFLNFVRPFQ